MAHRSLFLTGNVRDHGTAHPVTAHTSTHRPYGPSRCEHPCRKECLLSAVARTWKQPRRYLLETDVSGPLYALGATGRLGCRAAVCARIAAALSWKCSFGDRSASSEYEYGDTDRQRQPAKQDAQRWRYCQFLDLALSARGSGLVAPDPCGEPEKAVSVH